MGVESSYRRIELQTVSAARQLRPNGLLLWSGRSLIDGGPIAVVLTGTRRTTSNGKTGDMLQTWILRRDKSPLDAIRDGSSYSICGDCRHDHKDGAGSCYVEARTGPLAVFRALEGGHYPRPARNGLSVLTRGRLVRRGSDGDPSAAPAALWRQLLTGSAGWTGYTHQWRRARAQEYRPFLMASVDTESEQRQARSKGWRTFRVRLPGMPTLAGEVVCPASEDGGFTRTCETCGACDGAGTNARRASVVITIHGATYKVQRFARAVEAIRQHKRYRLGS